MTKLFLGMVAIVLMLSIIQIVPEAIAQTKVENFSGKEVIDARDGEVYQTVMIGNKRWFAENLRYDVPTVYTTDSRVDTILSEDGLKHYGRLYDWATVMNLSSSYNNESLNANGQSQGICPKGWHVSTDEEWKELERFMGMEEGNIEAVSLERPLGNMQQLISSEDWINSDYQSREGLFNVFPTGKYVLKEKRGLPPGFRNLGERATFWTSTENDAYSVWGRSIAYDRSIVSRYNKYPKEMGYSCRCVED